MIAQLLARNPDKAFIAEKDDAKALQWLVELELLGYLGPESKTRSFLFGYGGNPTHWIIAGVWRFPNPKEDWHYVYCWPKSRFTKEELSADYTRISGAKPEDIWRPGLPRPEWFKQKSD